MRWSFRTVVAIVVAAIASGIGEGQSNQPAGDAPPGHLTIRIATFNLGDVRTDDLKNPEHPRLKQLAEVIQRLRPNVILLNEIAYDMPGVLGVADDAQPGRNAQVFADTFLATPQSPGLWPMQMTGFMRAVNTGVSSGHDLDNNGRIVTTYPTPAPARADGSRPAPVPEATEYGGDCFGFGTFPGQYGMALLVDRRLAIVDEEVRTFRLMPWDFIPGALLPVTADGKPWYEPVEQADVRLSSKSHWDVPVKLPNGAVIHFLCSHPTPPVFDGPEDRNGRRNHDEIRFWADYIENSSYIVDDTNTPGGLDKRAHFVILGDLNADPDEGDAYKNPIRNSLLTSRRIHTDNPPVSEVAIEGLDPDDTSRFKLRVDYILPSRTLGVVKSGIWREPPQSALTGRPVDFPSDHFPVWMELLVPDEER
ncbi:MAG: hypothetical protein GIKADHBN_03717 [Phycisphaerales bacterium]|nr:hypothetical protein [Phycisphaerales bacterium]